MSIANLAARLDELDTTDAFVSEGETSVTVSGLSVGTATEVLRLIGAIGWSASAYDGAGSEWPLENLDQSYEPFRIEIEKPNADDGILRVLTNVGFANWLEKDDDRSHWQIGRLSSQINAVGVCFTSWDGQAKETSTDTLRRSPRLLVREYSAHRSVPASLDRWLLDQSESVALEDPTVAVWAGIASRKIMLSLPDEFDAERNILQFKGPPRLGLAFPQSGSAALAELGADGFVTLQECANWVFEIDRESEMRHILLSTEIARCGGTGDQAAPFFRENLSAAFEGAKTAYQVQLSGMSSDALKTLAELRKSVTDETAKVADANRQIITAVAGALAVGAGLIAARLTTTASPFLILLVMVMAGAYVAITILSGVMFTLLQRKVRKQWQPRLYRFLSEPDYDALVGQPARTAEKTLWWSSALGAIALAVMAIVIFQLPTNASTPTEADTTDVGNQAPPGNVSTTAEQVDPGRGGTDLP